MTAEASIYDFNLRQLFFRKIRLTSPLDSVQRLFQVPAENIDTDVHFVRLTLTDKSHHAISSNFYWLPKKLSTFDWSVEHEKQHPYYTGVTTYEDLSMLSQLQRVHVDASATAGRRSEGEEVLVRIHNPSKNLAFQIHLSIVDGENGEEVLPALWDDNYFSLMPGEARAVAAHYSSAANAARLRLAVNGWNIDAESIFVNRSN